MASFTIIRHIATIEEWTNVSLELNYGKWDKGEEKYDLRKWENGEPRKGVTLTEEDLTDLFYAIGEELDLLPGKDYSSIPIDYRCIFVHGDGECADPEHHDQEEVVAILPILRKDTMELEDIELNATFCRDCNAYYISEADYKKATKRGRLLCQLMSDEEYKEYKQSGKGWDELQPEGILMMAGYTVNSQDDFSDEYRQMILSYAIELEVITKERAVSYLNFFIKQNEGRPNFENAVAKWRKDRDYLNGYVSGSVRKVKGKMVVLK